LFEVHVLRERHLHEREVRDGDVDKAGRMKCWPFYLFLSRLVEIFHTLGGGIRGGDWKRLIGWKD